MTPQASPFLTAEWRFLAMLNYEIDQALLLPLVPVGTELDSWNGKTFISMVGFRFTHTRLLGLAIPFHRNFDEVNLRFYVRRSSPEGWRGGVVFIKEIVPRAAIAWVARRVFIGCSVSSRRVVARGIHHGTLLGLRATTRRRNLRVSSGASSLECVAGKRHTIGV